MADIEFTFSETGMLQFTGRVGQTVAITLDIPSATAYALNRPLPAGLTLAAGVISGTLARDEVLLYDMIDEDGITDSDDYLLLATGATTPQVRAYMVVLPATPSGTVATSDVTAILEAVNNASNSSSGSASTSSPSPTLTPDPNGFITFANSGFEIAKEWDYDLSHDIVFDPRDSSGLIKASGSESGVDFPEWAPDTFSAASIMKAKVKTRFAIALGLNRDGVLQDCDEEDIESIEIFAREIQEAPKLLLNEDGFTKMTNLDRYKVILDLSQAALLRELEKYQSPDGGYLDLRCEIKITFADPDGSGPAEAQVIRSDNFAIRLVEEVE